MVAINHNYLNSKPSPIDARLEGKTEPLPNITSSNLPHLSSLSHYPQDASFRGLQETHTQENVSGKETKSSTYLDMPLLISDHDGDDSEAESSRASRKSSANGSEHMQSALPATQEVKKSIKEEKDESTEVTQVSRPSEENEQAVRPYEQSDTNTTTGPQNDLIVTSEKLSHETALSPEAFNCEKNKVMKIVVKYVAMKITNSFPPPSSRTADSKEMPLDEFLMILVSRLQLTLSSFMKGIIYLFRYMDIIYLLRYVNQSNNFANYTDMGYELKKLIVACYRLVLARERKTKDWSGITGLKNAQINDVVKTVVGRLNGKLSIKPVELVRLRGEIFRFVTMVTKTV